MRILWLQNKFIGSATFVASSLSNIVDKLTKRIHKIKCKDCDCVLEYKHVNKNLVKYKCFSCNKNYSNNHINKLILLLRKDVEYMDEWEKFNETRLLEKENFHSNLNMQDITDSDYNHEK